MKAAVKFWNDSRSLDVSLYAENETKRRIELNGQPKAVDIVGQATDGRRSDGVLQGSN